MTGPVVTSTTDRRTADSGVSTSSGANGVAGIVGNIASDLAQLVRQELELATVELKKETTKAGKAAGLFGGAGAGAHIAATFLTLALVFGVSEWLDISLGWTALIAGVIWALTAAVMFAVARNRMKDIDPVPHQTIQTIKEGI